MAVGNTHSCALLKDGRVDCWGNNDFGQLGTGNWTSTPVPMAVPELDGGVCQTICGFLCQIRITPGVDVSSGGVLRASLAQTISCTCSSPTAITRPPPTRGQLCPTTHFPTTVNRAASRHPNLG